MTVASDATSKGRHARNEGNLRKAREHYAEAANVYRQQNNLLAYAHSIRHIAGIYQQCRQTGEIRAEGIVLNCGRRIGTAEGRVPARKRPPDCAAPVQITRIFMLALRFP